MVVEMRSRWSPNRASGVLGYAENDLNDLFVYVDPLHERPNDFSSSLPVSACQLRSNGSG